MRGYEPDCDSYSFDAGEWAGDVGDGREHQAEALTTTGAASSRQILKSGFFRVGSAGSNSYPSLW
jgi:hypothetical protein